MAVRKWPKWAVGISGVLSFTGFLYLTQNQQESAQALDGYGLDAGASAEAGTVQGGSNTTENKSGNSAKYFLYKLEEMKQIANSTEKDKSEREKLLEGLSWSTDPNAEVTLPAPSSQNTQPTASIQNTQPKSPVTTQSTRKTRRS